MKILHIANFNQFRLKQNYISNLTTKLNNGLIRLGHCVRTYSDRDMSRSLSFIGSMNALGNWRSQKHLQNVVDSYQPDAILLGHADTIKVETLALIRKKHPNIKILQYNVDWIVPKLADHNIQNLLSKIDVVDATIITTADERYLKMFNRPDKYLGFVPNPVDASMEDFKVYRQKDLPFDLMYCGRANGMREFCGSMMSVSDLVNSIEKQIPDIKLFLAGINAPVLNGADYLDAYKNASMGLNLSHINSVYLYSSDRIAHIIGTGQLCVIDDRTGYRRFFNDDEMCFYHEPDEFFEKIKYYTLHPMARSKVAKKGSEKYYKLFNETIVAQYVIDILSDQLKPSKYIWLE